MDSVSSRKDNSGSVHVYYAEDPMFNPQCLQKYHVAYNTKYPCPEFSKTATAPNRNIGMGGNVPRDINLY